VPMTVMANPTIAISDQTFAPLAHIAPIVCDREIIEEFAGKVITGPPHHLGAMDAHPEAQWVAHHVEQYDVAKYVTEIERISVAARREAPVSLLGQPIVKQSAQAGILNALRNISVFIWFCRHGTTINLCC
jgi:hypothetical protein